MHKPPNCAACGIDPLQRICRVEDGKGPAFCPTVQKTDLIEESRREFEKPEVREFARQASIQEAMGYANRETGYEALRPVKTRIEEIMEFAGRMGYRRLGLAFCIGLRQEAKAVESVFSARGFETVSVACKAGRVPKEEIGITDDEKIVIGEFEAMCNPILQAKVLNHENTELNVLLGLCVGHDSLFFQYAKAPCTVLAAKDRLMGHNPLAAVYQVGAYYRSIRNR
jgi:uncharacterized metal-binding protein